jgi:hypothetical protein
VPIHGPGGYLAIASLAGREAAFSPAERAALQMIVLTAHERCLEIVGAPPPWAATRLSRRETECLAWVAAGRTDSEIGDILSISDATVRWHIDNARRSSAPAPAPRLWRGRSGRESCGRDGAASGSVVLEQHLVGKSPPPRSAGLPACRAAARLPPQFRRLGKRRQRSRGAGAWGSGGGKGCAAGRCCAAARRWR